MRLGLLGCASALTLIGAAAAQAETFLITEPDLIATAPGYVYSAPAPLAAPGYVVTEPAPVVIAEPPAAYVVAPPATAVVDAPLVIAPRQRVIARERMLPRVTAWLRMSAWFRPVGGWSSANA